MDTRRKAAVGASAAAVAAIATTLILLTVQHYNVYLPAFYMRESKHGITLPSPCDDVRPLNGEWFYTWGLDNPCPDVNVQFIPMVWSVDYATALPGRTWPIGVSWLLGFNECNYRGQAECTAKQAADAWPLLEVTGRLLVSPAPAACSPQTDPLCIRDGLEWLTEFLQLVGVNRVDAIGVHWYGGKARDLYAYLEQVHGLAPGKPIWLTEFAATTPWGVDIEAFMQETIPHLAEHGVVRYAWFTTRANPAWWYIAPMVGDDGILTPLGQTYRQYGRHI
jgi:hypothetical protein